MALRTVGVKLAAEVSSYVGGIRTARTATKDFVGELDQAAKAGKLDAVADRAAHMGIALGAAFAGVVAITAKFDKQMSEVGAVANASAADLDRLRQAALQAGKDTAFSATEAAKAEAELAKAGLSTSQILGGALSGSLSLAAAGSLDLAESADIAAKTMNVFKLKGNDVGHIADVLAAAANKSATDVHEMGEALRMGGLAANSAGMSLEETVGTLSAFADRALVGSDAGTSLKTMLQMLAAPSEKAANLMEQLGIHAYDLQGNFIGTTKLAAELQRAFGNLTQEQRNAAMATIFGADAMRAANVLFEVGEKGIKDYTAAVDDQGAAAEVAAKKMDNLAGDVEKLKGSLETMAIEAGSGANGGLRTLVQIGDQLVSQFAALPSGVGSTVTVLAGLSAAALLAGSGWVRMRRATAEVRAELNQIGPAGARAARGLETTTKWAGRATGAFLALEVGSAAIASIFGSELNPQIEALGKGLASWGKDGRIAGESARLLGADLEKLDKQLVILADKDNSRRQWAQGLQSAFETILPPLQQTDSSLARTRERVSAMDAALAQLVQGGAPEDAAGAFDRLATMLASQGVSVDELRSLFPQYNAALETSAGASNDAADAIGGVGQQAGMTAEQVEELKNAFDRLFGIQMDADRALIAYRQGMADLNKELKDGKRTLDTNTQAGRDNASALLDQVDHVKDLRDANLAGGMAMDKANAKYQEQIAGLIALAIKLGFSEQQVRDLIGAYGDIPESVSTQVSAPGVTTSTKQVETFNQTIRNIPPSKRVPFWTNAAEQTAAVEALRLKIANLRGKTVTVRAQVYWTSSGDLHVPGGTLTKNERGGVYEHAAVGVLRDAHIASPMGPARYAYAEKSTGGEAFIPKFGDMDRSRAIWDYVGQNWLGMNNNMSYAQPTSSGQDLGPLLAAVQRLDGRLASLVKALPEARLRIDDRSGRIVDLLTRGG